MRILRRVVEKKPELLQDCLPAGLKQAAAFHEHIRSNYRASSSASAAGKRCACAIAGILASLPAWADLTVLAGGNACWGPLK